MKEQFSQNNLEKFDKEALDAFIADLNQYDEDHSPSTWVGRGLAGMIMQGMNEEKTGTEDEMKSDKGLEDLQNEIQKNLTIDDLENKHNPTLNRLGLNLESANKKGNFDENETYAIGSIKINLEDKRKYLLFLKSLDKEKITETQKKILEMTVDKLIDQVQNEYKLEEADDRLLELFGGMREIVLEYERLGMGEKVNDFKDYLEYSNSGYLREYIFSKNKGMFKPIGEGFALSTYQRDASHDYYIKYWNSFFETLEEIKKNPKAKEFYNQVLKYGQDCIAFAEKDPELTKYKESYLESIRKGIKEVKEKVSKILSL